jgi:pyridoxal phosphate enzyme (YggS family)
VTEPAPTLAERLGLVRQAVEDAAALANRPAESITTVVVTKFHPASLVRELFELGVRNVGENRHQDAAPKARELSDLGLTWHFVGQLQSNKVRAVLDYARVIQSVDRESLAAAISAAAPTSAGGEPVDIFLQVNLTDDDARGGVSETDLLPLVETVLTSSGLRLRGLMAVAPLGEDPRSAFARVRAASEKIIPLAPAATQLSMGMSGDFREAILEGATHLRIGTAITGKRPAAG